MGQNNNRHALVSMTNKDVYQLTQANAKTLMDLIESGHAPAFWHATDARSGASISIATANISSVVIPEGFKNFGVNHD